MNYRYDQLHRIAAAHASKWEGIWTTVEGSYNTSYAYDGNGNIQNLYRNNLEATTIDELYYHYDPVKKNRLDVVKDGGTAEGLNNANPYEYKYDQIGNLTQNLEDGIEDIEWNIYGKVEKVTKTPDPFGIQATVEYRYDGTGNRIMKKVSAGATSTTTTYLRDASGNVMAIYEEKTDQTLAIKEIPIYGSSRLGQYRPKTDTKKTALGQRIYEFSNHLGNVLVTLTDNKVPQTDGTYESVVVSASDYYPFGMAMAERTYSNSEYRYGFNGKEKDWDIAVGKTDFGARIYDEIIGRWFSTDPLKAKHPDITPYHFVSNNPILKLDPDGKDGRLSITVEGSKISIKYSTTVFLFGDGLNSTIIDDNGVEQKLEDVIVEKLNSDFQILMSQSEDGQKFVLGDYEVSFDLDISFSLMNEKARNDVEEIAQKTTKKGNRPYSALRPSEMLAVTEKIDGFQKGDNVLQIKSTSDGYELAQARVGPYASMLVKNIYNPIILTGYYSGQTAFHETLHMMGLDDLYDYASLLDKEGMIDLMSNTTLNVKDKVYIPQTHFIELTIYLFKHFYSGKNMNEVPISGADREGGDRVYTDSNPPYTHKDEKEELDIGN